jgi:hypothetical protein
VVEGLGGDMDCKKVEITQELEVNNHSESKDDYFIDNLDHLSALEKESILQLTLASYKLRGSSRFNFDGDEEEKSFTRPNAKEKLEKKAYDRIVKINRQKERRQSNIFSVKTNQGSSELKFK